jgi:hypothetical protein
MDAVIVLIVLAVGLVRPDWDHRCSTCPEIAGLRTGRDIAEGLRFESAVSCFSVGQFAGLGRAKGTQNPE